ncbi:hypothetical protein CXG81DRAFT_20278 [Caulochytrium protostelioides]|uniref:Uncharacterized protein n=1 Tax=Caulochytrium protostelioides TaxID=1555241 RepID=A0A4P9X3Q7_9FUNG|nr:hypothetical protein CXG81DRAFT_20278 [Caulochytrium protostelioides]|eukprot:RKO99679.1 hypothetical protein CXG81DRAFT_20278 [Caulochytrium protostelioides]
MGGPSSTLSRKPVAARELPLYGSAAMSPRPRPGMGPYDTGNSWPLPPPSLRAGQSAASLVPKKNFFGMFGKRKDKQDNPGGYMTDPCLVGSHTSSIASMGPISASRHTMNRHGFDGYESAEPDKQLLKDKEELSALVDDMRQQIAKKNDLIADLTSEIHELRRRLEAADTAAATATAVASTAAAAATVPSEPTPAREPSDATAAGRLDASVKEAYDRNQAYLEMIDAKSALAPSTLATPTPQPRPTIAPKPDAARLALLAKPSAAAAAAAAAHPAETATAAAAPPVPSSATKPSSAASKPPAVMPRSPGPRTSAARPPLPSSTPAAAPVVKTLPSPALASAMTSASAPAPAPPSTLASALKATPVTALKTAPAASALTTSTATLVTASSQSALEAPSASAADGIIKSVQVELPTVEPCFLDLADFPHLNFTL